MATKSKSDRLILLDDILRSLMQARVGRTPIKLADLHRVLSNEQIRYFHALGGRDAMDRYSKDTVWWYHYFGQVDNDPQSKTYGQPLDQPIPLDLWDDPGADVSNKLAYVKIGTQLMYLLGGARTNRAVQRKLYADGLYPPNLGKDPYEIPAYFGWWQSENAFRRGFMAHYEDAFMGTFKSRLKELHRRDGGVLTQSGMEELAEEYNRDPYLNEYFSALAENIEQGKPAPFNSLKAFWDDLNAKRDLAYEQFSPYYRALRWASGGLVGIEPE